MRTDRVVIVAALAFVIAAGGCTPPRATGTVSQSQAGPHAHAPAPANPDLASVMERFYQQIEGAHWRFAYAMLSPRYRKTIGEDGFAARYSGFAELDVSLRHPYGGRVVFATVGAKERAAPARARRFEETTTLAWDGEDWKIDRIVRRDVSPAHTR